MMFFHRRHGERDEEVARAMADHDEAVRLFTEKFLQAEEDHSREVKLMLRGLIPVHKKGKKE